MRSEPAYISMGRQEGSFLHYPCGSVYKGDRIIGHRECPKAPGLDRTGAGCQPGWRIERDSEACREYEREVLNGNG